MRVQVCGCLIGCFVGWEVRGLKIRLLRSLSPCIVSVNNSVEALSFVASTYLKYLIWWEPSYHVSRRLKTKSASRGSLISAYENSARATMRVFRPRNFSGVVNGRPALYLLSSSGGKNRAKMGGRGGKRIELVCFLLCLSTYSNPRPYHININLCHYIVPVDLT